MATRILMPKLGLTMTEGTITEWVVDAGEKVEKGSVVMLIETDKVEAEVEADADGIVQYVANVGDTLEPGEVVGWLLADEENAKNENEEEPSVEETVEEQTPSNQEIDTSEPELSSEQNIGESVPQQESEESQSSDRILASPNAKRVAKEKGIDLQQVPGSGPSGRITSEDVHAMNSSVPAASNGRILASPNAKRVAKEKGIDLQTITGTGPGGRITSEDVIEAPKPEVQAPSQAPEIEEVSQETIAQTTVPFAARKAAEQLGVNLTEVKGSGPDGRVTKQDVFAHSRTHSAQQQTPKRTSSPTELDGNRTPIKGMRAIIADRMHSSLQEMAQLTLTMDVNMGRVVELREQLKDIGSEELGAVPSYTDFVIAAAAQALIQHPAANSQIDGNDIVELNQINVGMAVAVPDGLVVPVVHGTDKLELAEIAMETSRLAEAARNKKLSLAEMEGGTFSVTALGMYGVDAFTPVINPPNSGILGVGRIRDDVDWDGDTPIKVKRMTISLTWDHRVLDGAPAAEFAATIKSFLEQPLRLLA